MSQQPPNQPNWNPNQQPPSQNPLQGQPTYQQVPGQQPHYPNHYPYQQPPQAPRKQSVWQWYRSRNRPVRLGLGCVAILVALFLCTAVGTGIVQGVQAGTANGHTTVTQPVSQATQAPTDTPTPVPVSYPPKTQDDLHALARQGDASQIHGFHNESTGLVGACPQPKSLVTVDKSLTGKQLVEDLLAYFYANHMDSPCGSIVFVYHSQSESGDNSPGQGVYTAGRIDFTVKDSTGQVNVDPNATGLSYTLTIDDGDGSQQTQHEYIVQY